MKIECIRDSLLRACSIAERATGKHLPLIILGQILIKVSKNILSVTATNLDFGVSINIPVKTQKEGAVALNGNIIENYLANLPNQAHINIELVKEQLVVSSQASSAVIATHPIDDFPQLPVIKKEDEIGTFSLDSDNLTIGIQSVFYAASNTDIKPEMASILVQQKLNDLIFTATDSFRLAEKRVEIKNSNGGEAPPLLIPVKNAIEIAHILEKEKGTVSVSYSKDLAVFKTENIYLTSRLIDAQFPEYNQLIAREFQTQAVALKEDLFDALRLAGFFSDKFHQITLRILPDDATFEFQSKKQGVGESIAKVDSTLEGVPVDLNINGRYLLDCLSSINKDSVNLGFNGQKALLVRGVGDRSFIYLLMPLHR